MAVLARTWFLLGLEAIKVEVEVAITRTPEPWIKIVGVPDSAVRESRERVKAAINASGFTFPNGGVLVNLAPAAVRKTGAAFDLPIALGILAASDQVSVESSLQYLSIGELSLSGDVRRSRGLLPALMLAHDSGLKGVIGLGDPGPFVSQRVNIIPCPTLADAVAHLDGDTEIPPLKPEPPPPPSPYEDLSDVKGQRRPKTALITAAAGGHNLLFAGTPGTGKTMLMTRLPHLLPPPSPQEELEIARIHSVAGIKRRGRTRPFRSPHHTVSHSGLAGGGNPPSPGEITLAHSGILFLDELPEFRKAALETLRGPLEEGTITLSRAAATARFPARFMLAASMNPCPCGYRGHPQRPCRCTPSQIRRYLDKVSGPILDRFDLRVEVGPIRSQAFRDKSPSVRTEEAREAVIKARERQAQRYRDEPFSLNCDLPVARLPTHASLEPGAEEPLTRAIDSGRLSARAYVRVIRVARTLADLRDSDAIEGRDIATSLSLRAFDPQERVK